MEGKPNVHDWRPEIRRRLANLQLEPTREAAIVEELAQHLADCYAELRASGATEAEAEHQTLAELSGNELLARELRRLKQQIPPEPIVLGANRRTNMIADLWQDLRFGARMLLKQPGFSLIAVLTLALGIGANTAIFSLVDSVLLKTLPVNQPEQLVIVATGAPGQQSPPGSSFSYPLFRELRDKQSSFSGIIARAVVTLSLRASGQAERVVGEVVSGNFFSVLGVPPLLGRVFTEADDQTPGAHPVAVISHHFWQRRLAADPNIVGKTIHLNGYPITVIGVTRPGFYGVEVGVGPDVRIPLMMYGLGRKTSIFEQRGISWLEVMARLKPGVSLQPAEAATDVIYQIAREPDVRQVTGEDATSRDFRGARIRLLSAAHGFSSLSHQFSPSLKILMCVAGIVLLITCLNVANLLLARAVARRKEMATRLALGAGRSRLARQLLTESLLLAVSGGLLGLFFARWGTDVLLRFLPQGFVPTLVEVKLDMRMLGFTLGVTLLAGMLFGLAPALQATRTDLIPALKAESGALAGGRRRWELRRLFVILQVALTLLLLVVAGLFGGSLQNLKALTAEYQTDQVLLLSFDPGQKGYSREQIRNFYAQLLEQAQTLPGVKQASIVRIRLFSSEFRGFGIEVEGYQPKPGEMMAVLVNMVEPKFFATMGLTLMQGRDFTPRDDERAPRVAIINEAVARRYFGGQSPLGRKLTLEDYQNLEIVGVMRDAKYRNLREEIPLTVYLPLQQTAQVTSRTLCVRTEGDPKALLPALRRVVQALDKDLPVFDVQTFTEQVNRSLNQERLVATLSGFFGVLALLLACIGLYGVMSYAVARRTNEIGIRMALGARPANVVRLVMREVFLLVLLGAGIGLTAALGATRLVSTLLFGLTPTDPLTITLATLLLIGVAGLAGYLPARRASRVDPIVALRSE
jgi:predicted permease